MIEFDDWGEEISHWRLGTITIRPREKKIRTAQLLATLPHEIDKIKAERWAASNISDSKRDAREIVHGLGGPEVVAAKLNITVDTVLRWIHTRTVIPVARLAELRAAFPEQVGRVLPPSFGQEKS
ncbi:MAG: hypothetical protein V2I26_11430 [Halieaceae bacterium]|nr:hypothetical protein [Halieaceae bacterium]